MSEVEISIRETRPEDAAAFQAAMMQIGGETEFLVMDEKGMSLSPELLAQQIQLIQESPNNLSLVALAGEEIIGTASVLGDSQPRVAHIGEVGISVKKDYWGMGLGSYLMEELLYWAESSGVIRRLELTVQVQNQRAVQLYEKFDFMVEGTLERGARSDEGEFLDVYLMSRMIDPAQ